MHKYLIKIFFITFFILSMLIQFTGCGGTSSNTDLTNPTGSNSNLDYGRIKGKVIASDSSIVSGAIVETYQTQTTTASDGMYLLGPIPAGDYRVIARYSGYAPSALDKVRVYPGKITENIDFTLNVGLASYSPDFAVVTVVPQVGTDGDLISVFCKGCGKDVGKVYFNGKEAVVIDWNTKLDDQIIVQAPLNVETGPVTVKIGNEVSHETQAVLFIGKPIIFSASPSIAKGNQKITLGGRNFNSIANFNRVKLSGSDCTVISVATSSTMDILLPQNAQTGKLSIKIESNEYQFDGMSNVVVTIQPEIVYISPKRSIPGVPLTVYGYNFGTDKNVVKVLFGDYIILPEKFLSFSDTKISFAVPDNTILAPGAKADIKVQVLQSPSNGLSYTAYNTINNTITNYGIYNFNTVSTGGKLHLQSLKPTDRIAFLNVLSGDGTQNLDDNYSFIITSFLGGNFVAIPTLPANVRLQEILVKTYNNRETIKNYHVNTKIRPSSLRGSLSDPASTTIEMYLRDFKSSDPWDATNDILATGTLKATSTRALVYFDVNIAGLTDDDAKTIGNVFDNVYETIATACWDGLSTPPEGDIDAQPKIAIFVSPTLNETTSSTVTNSYFNARDKDPTQPNSAGTEIIFVNSEIFTNPDELKATLAFSLQSMMYFNQKSFERTDWQSFGLSTFARQEVGLGFEQGNTLSVDRVADYLTHADAVSLTHWPSPAYYYNYGMAFLFTQYLFDRCGGYNAIRVLEKQNGAIGVVDINANIIGAGLANPPAASFQELFHDFCISLYCDDLGLIDAFPGYDKDKHQFSSIKLRGNNAKNDGIRGVSYYEEPVSNRLLSLKGFGCNLFEYNHGNWGDLEVTITGTPTDGDFKTWVIYYSTE